MLVFLAVVLMVVSGFLKRDNERLQRRNRELEGVDNQLPGRAESWISGIAITVFPLICVISLTISPLLILAQARDATAQLPQIPWMRSIGIPFTITDSRFYSPPTANHAWPTGKECEPIPPSRLWNQLEAAAEREGLSTGLLEAVIFQESRFGPCAVSSSGALGLMQLMPGTAAELGVNDPFDPRQNIEGGARFLGRLLVRYRGNLELALAAYHAGPSRVDQHGAVPPIPKTRTYVNDVLGFAALISESN